MRDARGDVVYVGKAQSFRSRVRSYWQKATPAGDVHRIRSVIDKVVDVETALTDSVSEALLLKANLIKRFRAARDESELNRSTASRGRRRRRGQRFTSFTVVFREVASAAVDVPVIVRT